MWRCETNTASSHLLGTRAPWITGLFVSRSFYALLRLMGIVSLVSVTGHQRLTFVFLSATELKWLGSTSFQSVTFSTNTAFRNGFLPILCSLCRILGRLAGLVLSHAGNDLYFTFHCSHPAWVNHSRCGCHSKPETDCSFAGSIRLIFVASGSIC